jgi:GxxExxY protein
MNTDMDERPDFRGGGTKLILKEKTRQVIGSSFEVLNGIGHRLHEKIYENALVVEFKIHGISFDQQKRFPVTYKGVQLGEFIPDLIAYGSVIVDAKVIDQITDHERGK